MLFRRLLLSTLSLFVLVCNLSGETLEDFIKRLPSSTDAGFRAANARDLSLYQTWSRYQAPTGSCTAFSAVAAVEAAYTRKYCGDPNSDFYKAGYCERYEKIKAGNLPNFYLGNSANFYYAYDAKDLDLSELYFIQRALSSWTTSASCPHENGNVFCHLDGITRGVAGDMSFGLANLKLPEEKYAEFIYDVAFYNDSQRDLYGTTDCGKGISPSQEKLDEYNFTDRKRDFLTWDSKPLHRAYIPEAARRNARFGVSEFVYASTGQLGDVVSFLERCIYAKYEVAAHGAVPGHSMLLTGYDRTAQKFFFKDHYHDWQWVDYATVRDNLDEVFIVVEPSPYTIQPNPEEMWIGAWDVSLDGRPGKIVIRRTRLAPNVLFGTADLYGKDIHPIISTLWARVGSYYETDGSKHVVYGRLNDSDGSTMELRVDFSQPEGPPPSPVILGDPPGQKFEMRMFEYWPGAGMIATGTTSWMDLLYGVIFKRAEFNPYGTLPMTPATGSFSRAKWPGRYDLLMDLGLKASLELTSTNGGQTLSGSLTMGNTKVPVTVFWAGDNHIFVAGTFPPASNFIYDLAFHTWDERVISGDYESGTIDWPVYGIKRASYATSMQAKAFFPLFDTDPAFFNAFAVSNYSDAPAHLEFTAFNQSGQSLAWPSNPAVRNLQPDQQVAELSTEVFSNKPGSNPSAAWVELNTDNPDIAGFFQFGNGNQLDGTVSPMPVKEFYFTRIYAGSGTFHGKTAGTLLYIANPSTRSASIRLDIFKASGEDIHMPRTVNLGPKAVFQQDVFYLFGTVATGGYIRGRVMSGDGVLAAEVVKLKYADTAFALNAQWPSESVALYSAQMAAAPGYFTSLNLLNVSSETRHVTIKAISETGQTLGTPVVMDLLAGGVWESDIRTAFGFGTGGIQVGSIKIQADGSGLIGDIIFGDPSSDVKYLAALALQDLPFRKAVFSHVANGLGFFTGIAIYNPFTEAADVTLKVYTKTGALTGQWKKTLQGGERLSKVVTELVPASAGQLGGYILIESTQAIIAQQLFATGGLNFLSAVPAVTVQ